MILLGMYDAVSQRQSTELVARPVHCMTPKNTLYTLFPA
jgi:hypothetical protein